MRPLCFVFALAVALLPAASTAALPPEEGHALVQTLMSGKPGEAKEAARKLTAAKDLSLAPPLVDALFFTPTAQRGPLLDVLRTLTGEDPGPRYYDWVELVGRRSELRAGPGYEEWKASLLSKIDPGSRASSRSA